MYFKKPIWKGHSLKIPNLFPFFLSSSFLIFSIHVSPSLSLSFRRFGNWLILVLTFSASVFFLILISTFKANLFNWCYDFLGGWIGQKSGKLVTSKVIFEWKICAEVWWSKIHWNAGHCTQISLIIKLSGFRAPEPWPLSIFDICLLVFL